MQKWLDTPPDDWVFTGPFRAKPDELEALVQAIRYLIHRPDLDTLIDQDNIAEIIRLREEQP